MARQSVESIDEDDQWKNETNEILQELFTRLSKKQLELAEKQKKISTENERLNRYKDEIEEEHAKYRQEITESVSELKLAYESKLNALEEEKRLMKDVYKFQNEKIKLDVGGCLFSTSRTTLCKEEGTMLAAMFSGRHKLVKSDDGSFFIDRDGTYFRYILNYLRGRITERNDLPNDKQILREIRLEADFYQLTNLVEFIDMLIANDSIGQNDYTQDDINKILSTVVRIDKAPFAYGFNITNSNIFSNGISELANAAFSQQNYKPGENDPKYSKPEFMVQNMTKSKLDFTGKNLSQLSFAHTTFNHSVSFKNCNLSAATFYGCEFSNGITIDFTYADLRDCDFRNCKGKEAGPRMSFGPSTFEFGSGGLVSGASSDIFLQMVQTKKIIFRGAKIDGAKFDPNVHDVVKTVYHNK